jgi:predicted ABC-type ATPase
MIAGPNGAGKTTLTLELIKDREVLYEFINADEIAKGLAPLNPESVALAASKLMILRLKELLNSHKSFAFETTASGTNYIKHLKEAKKRGYEIRLVFLWLATPKQAIKRVAQRVEQGGHHVPKDTIIRRYHLGVKNLLRCYLPLADSGCILDNSRDTVDKKIIAQKNGVLEILDEKLWEKLEGQGER